MSQAPPPHPLADLLLTLVLPSLVLETLSKPGSLGPLWALVLASVIPVCYGLWCWQQKRGLNFFSLFGLAAIIITGGLGLLNLDATWFAAKEAVFPIVLGLSFPITSYLGRPLIQQLLLNPQFINEKAILGALNSNEKQNRFRRLIHQASWGMMLATCLSAAANFMLALRLLSEKAPGSESYVQAIGKLNWMGFIVIGIPLVLLTLALLLWLLGRLTALTGLEKADLLNPGKTVRRQIH